MVVRIMQLEEWLDDLCVRFLVNLPIEELSEIERICFQLEEAQWYYEDFIRAEDPSLPALPLKQFCFRMFRHCSLFENWTHQQIETAFNGFILYKQRVPVRGAIMLNEAMDKAVLVKGYKKGANWSFPRGKINKDENDLDCAIREVYEETGFDLHSAGLVKSEKETKYIEITMREQHMKLFVFRGIPEETHFAPRTRKEIGKIEWYKLTDLPASKKRPHPHDGIGDEHTINVNKFYMVAAFIPHLKKWIAQQRRKDKPSSSLAAPPTLAEESATEYESLPQSKPHLKPTGFATATPSTLPEVAVPQSHQQLRPQLDAAAHIKGILNIGVPPASAQAQGVQLPKANDLLALLRNDAPQDTHNDHQHLQQHVQLPQQFSQPSQLGDLAGFSGALPRSSFFERSQASPPDQQKQADLLNLFQTGRPSNVEDLHPQPYPLRTPSQEPKQLPAPYRRHGDFQIHQDSPEISKTSVVPPAHALPKLTQHTQLLLNAFKTGPASKTSRADQIQSHSAAKASESSTHSSKQNLLELLTRPSRVLSSKIPIDQGPEPILQAYVGDSLPQDRSDLSRSNVTAIPAELSTSPAASSLPQMMTRTGPNQSLLAVFQQSTMRPLDQSAVIRPESQTPDMPAELSAAPSAPAHSKEKPLQSDRLAALFHSKENSAERHGPLVGVTDGALSNSAVDKPNRQVKTRHSKSRMQAEPEIPRSLNSQRKTLYDPNHPLPVRILSKQEENSNLQKTPLRSHKPHSSSSLHASHSQEKVFQPQILRRPQTAQSRSSLTPSPSSIIPESRRPSNLSTTIPSPPSELAAIPSPAVVTEAPRSLPYVESHTRDLLSLFGTSPALGSGTPMTATQNPSMLSNLVSPALVSQVVSPVTIAEDPISTRSRVGSLTSMMNEGQQESQLQEIPVRERPERKQTAEHDKAFLLKYLNRMASQEG